MTSGRFSSNTVLEFDKTNNGMIRPMQRTNKVEIEAFIFLRKVSVSFFVCVFGDEKK